MIDRKSYPDLNGNDPLSIRTRAIVELLYGCGLRTSELCHLKVEDMGLKGQTVTMRKGKDFGDFDREILRYRVLARGSGTVTGGTGCRPWPAPVNPFRESVRYLRVSGNSLYSSCARIHPKGMDRSFTLQYTSVEPQVLQQRRSLHEMLRIS